MSKSIFIIDDSRVSRMMIRAIVSKLHPDWTINEAENSDDTFAKISDRKPVDFFSVDYNMPGLDGLTLIEKLREDYPKARFALLTANIQDAIRTRAYEMSVICVNKPITESSVNEILEYFNDE